MTDILHRYYGDFDLIKEKWNEDYESILIKTKYDQKYKRCRLAKKTPKKEGYFTVFWKKDQENKNIPYTESNYMNTEKGWDVSALSFHKVCQVLYKNDAMNEWGSIVALTYMAAQRSFPDYNDMADNKAYLESIARSFGYFFGKDKKVRVNTISQSPTATTAGQGVKGFDGFIAYADAMSPLGNATAQDCADYTVSLFSDLTRKVTMQNLFHDGGFSNTGVSQEVIERFAK